MSVTVHDRNRIPEIQKELAAFNRLQVRAGVFSSAGRDIAARATANEFGLGNCPERSVFRAAMAEHKELFATHAAQGYGDVLTGKATARDVYESLGMMMHERIVNKMNEQIPPPLAASTVKKKGTDKTWIDTGETRGSVTHKVEGRKK